MNDDELKRVVQRGNDLQVGDKVRLIVQGGRSPLAGYDKDGIYTVKDTARFNSLMGRHMIEIKGGRLSSGYADPHELERV